MRTFICKVAFCLCAIILSACAENHLLDVKVKCKGNGQCIYKGEDRFLIDIVIANKHKTAIGYPLEFLRDSGPSIQLKDMHSGKETLVPIGPPYAALQEKFTMIAPGKIIGFGVVN